MTSVVSLPFAAMSCIRLDGNKTPMLSHKRSLPHAFVDASLPISMLVLFLSYSLEKLSGVASCRHSAPLSRPKRRATKQGTTPPSTLPGSRITVGIRSACWLVHRVAKGKDVMNTRQCRPRRDLADARVCYEHFGVEFEFM